MPLKYKFHELFKGQRVASQTMYKQLEDLDSQINDGADAKPVVKENVKLTKSGLSKAFGKKFNSIGIVHNEEGSYLIIAYNGEFKHIALEDI